MQSVITDTFTLSKHFYITPTMHASIIHPLPELLLHAQDKT